MTDNTAPREAIARSMTSGFSRRVWDGDFNPSPDSEYNKAVRDHVRSDYLNDADLVIAHLWRMADDPEVVEAGAKCHFRHKHGLLSDREFDALPDHRKRILTEEAAATVFGAVTALLGPRPSGEEAEHG